MTDLMPFVCIFIICDWRVSRTVPGCWELHQDPKRSVEVAPWVKAP